MPKVYDAFLFFNELDILELRLELLNDYVDYFILSECDYSFQGNPKPFYFEENKHLFQKYLDKIIHVKHYNSDVIENIQNPYTDSRKEIFDSILNYYYSIKDTAETDFGKHNWCRDFLHREFVKLGMVSCKDDDIILFGDLDEIPNPKMLDLTGITYIHELRHITFSLDLENVSEPFSGTIVTKFENIKKESLGFFRNRKRCGGFKKMTNSGWHLTSLGGADRVKTKIQNWGHAEFNNSGVLSNVESNIKQGKDVFGRPATIMRRSLSELYPDYIEKLLVEKYSHLIIS